MAADDPLGRFQHLFERAQALEGGEPRSAALATADAQGRPSVRMVLLASVDDSALLFLTSHESRKARDLAQNPWAALCFHWPSLSSQVRVEGGVTRSGDEESDTHFRALPRGQQVTAWAAHQSHPLGSRRELVSSYRDVEARWSGQPIPRPESWGGYRLVPQAVEFWHAYPNRLHDRLRYELVDGRWRLSRLAP
jgi:pyridoxamine 5'-phosphate oxidase